jgi:hypothetical protein
MNKWIGDEYSNFTPGETGFLVEKSHNLKGWTSWELREHPPRTNMSNVPHCVGWCGTTNDVSVHGHGLWRVVRVAKNGRALVERLQGDALQAALDEIGYPDLMDDCEG